MVKVDVTVIITEEGRYEVCKTEDISETIQEKFEAFDLAIVNQFRIKGDFPLPKETEIILLVKAEESKEFEIKQL